MGLDIRLQQKLADNLSSKQEVFIDPATIMLIITITNVLIEVIKKCKEKPSDAVVVAHFPTTREKRVLKRKLRHTLGWKRYWSEGDKYYQAVLATGRESTIGDFEEGYALGGRS